MRSNIRDLEHLPERKPRGKFKIATPDYCVFPERVVKASPELVLILLDLDIHDWSKIISHRQPHIIFYTTGVLASFYQRLI